MSIRWTFTDRHNGNRVTVPGPTTKAEREQLTTIIRNVRPQGALA